jgi:hypothetical protein
MKPEIHFSDLSKSINPDGKGWIVYGKTPDGFYGYYRLEPIEFPDGDFESFDEDER